MNLKCPVCHAKFSIEQLTQDEAAREMLRMRPLMLPSMMPYLTLFRTGKRDLAFDKALQLTRDAYDLCPDLHRLETALSETVRAIRNKRDEGTFKALKDHKYLLKVLENTRPEAKGPRPEDNPLTSNIEPRTRRQRRRQPSASCRTGRIADEMDQGRSRQRPPGALIPAA